MLTALGSLLVSLVLERRSRIGWQRETQLDAAREVLGALQNFNRKLIDVARMDQHGAGAEGGEWEEHHQAAIRWNAARYAAALVCPEGQIAQLNAIDKEFDRLLDLAIQRRWSSSDFREERQQLGRLAAAYLVDVRTRAGQETVHLESLWPWHEDPGTRAYGEP